MAVRSDSGYFEFDYVLSYPEDVENEDEEAPASPKRQGTLRKSASTTSIHSNASRGSSQFWEGVVTPDETLLDADNFESQPKLRDETPKCNRVSAPRPHDNVDDDHEGEASEVYESKNKRPKLDHNDDDPFVSAPRPTEISLEAFGTFAQKLSKYSSMSVVPIVVAHSDPYQRYFDKHKLPWGVQWEIARLASCGKLKYEDIPIIMLNRLAGKSNAIAAPMVEDLLLGRTVNEQRRQIYNEAFAREINVKTPWSELDQEEERLARDPLSGLGSTDLQDDWFGGKVSFVAKLRFKDEKQNKAKNRDVMSKYKLELESPVLGPSNRIARRWGSWRFLRIRITDPVKYGATDLLSYFSHPVVIHGRVFRPFYAKESSVFLVEVNQTYSEHRLMLDPSTAKPSLEEFLEWHNPMRINTKQSLSKWSTRMALGLSSSVPGIEVSPEDIMEIDDFCKHDFLLVAAYIDHVWEDTPTGRAAIAAGHKPEAKDITTDGCGFTNLKTLFDSKVRYNWDLLPCAVQFRMEGKKGLLLRHPNDNGTLDTPPRIWTRPSQKKISYDPSKPRDRAHLVIDILRRSHLKFPATLSNQIIVNLAENGVSYDIFERLMIDGLEALVASLTQWNGRYAMQNLWGAVARLGGVIKSRMSREAAGLSRALGFGFKDQDDEEDYEDEDGIDIPSRSKAWWADEVSGCPSSLEENVLILLDAGFEPQSCHVLAAKLKEVFKKALNSYIEKYKIEVPRSAEAWIVPDPCNVLAPGEIFLRTSELIIDQDGMKTNQLLGEVLITRHPCCLPSDVQKVRAVWKEELRDYYDVIIFSTQGDRSLASMLGGGDYDGDTGRAIWDPDVVAAFKSPNDKFADPPPGLDDAFEGNTMTVGKFLDKYRGPSEEMVAERQNYLLGTLKNPSLIGLYGNWHETAVYRHGYDSDEAWRMAYMFCAVLDSSKTGKVVKREVRERDSLAYNGPPPEWKQSLLEEMNFVVPRDQGVAPRRLVGIEFIMDKLKDAARKQYHHHLACFEKLLDESRQKFKDQNSIMPSHLYVDPALEAPWNEALVRAQKLIQTYNQHRMKEELEFIRKHVESVCEKHQENLRQDKKGKQFADKPIERRQDVLRELSISFSQMAKDREFLMLSPEDVRRYKASYAYIYDTGKHERRNNGFARFPFDVAMRELGIIKASSIGPCNMVTSRFYSVFNVAGAIKAFHSLEGAAYVC